MRAKCEKCGVENAHSSRKQTQKKHAENAGQDFLRARQPSWTNTGPLTQGQDFVRARQHLWTNPGPADVNQKQLGTGKKC
eukprot:5110229-Amphidinium_carterae.1